MSVTRAVAQSTLEEIARAQFLDEFDAAEDSAQEATNAIVSAVAKKNQFVGFDPSFESAIAREVSALASAIAKGEARDVAIARAKESIVKIMRGALGERPVEVTAATYSPELQLEILSLHFDGPNAMREPILDVGCGADAALVRFLRAQKKDARGLDRECPPDAGVRGDWLTFEYGAARFGTITSHLGFSLHFVHQEMKRSDLAFDYARAYMRIVRALAPGGTFAYVPGLPFIETILPRDEIDVTIVPLSRALVTENVARVQEATGLVLDSASHVTRRSSR